MSLSLAVDTSHSNNCRYVKCLWGCRNQNPSGTQSNVAVVVAGGHQRSLIQMKTIVFQAQTLSYLMCILPTTADGSKQMHTDQKAAATARADGYKEEKMIRNSDPPDHNIEMPLAANAIQATPRNHLPVPSHAPSQAAC